jgi:hypothetical protein
MPECDRCGGKTKAKLIEFGGLYFCGYCYPRHLQAIIHYYEARIAVLKKLLAEFEKNATKPRTQNSTNRVEK